MFDPKSLAEIIGLALILLAIAIGAHVLIERIFNSSLFNVFRSFTPAFLRAVFPYEPAIAFFEYRSLRGSVYDIWDIFIIYLILLPIILFIYFGFWIFLLLQLLSIIHINYLLLIVWFVFLIFFYLISAVQQIALTIKFQHPKWDVNKIISYMISNPVFTAKLGLKHFFRNWGIAPLTSFKLLFITVLGILFFWPYWIFSIFNKKYNLNNTSIRNKYFIAYAAICAACGALLNFIFN